MLNKYTSLFLSALLCALFIHAQTADAKKPSPSIQVFLTPSQPGVTPSGIHPGDMVEFTAAAKSSINAENIRIEIELTGGAELVSGDTSWSGQAVAGEERSISFIVRAPTTGRGKVRARVSVPGNHRQSFSAEAHYLLGVENANKAQRRPQIKKDSRGRNIIEYR